MTHTTDTGPGNVRLLHRSDGRLHYSDLRHLGGENGCPAHYRYAVEHPKVPTRPMTVGSVTDSLVFGNQTVAVYPGKVRNGKEWDAFQVAHARDIICIQSEYDDARSIAAAVLSDERACATLEGCMIQPVYQWESHGFECGAGIHGVRGGFDAIHLEKGYIPDLKITIRGGLEALKRHCQKQLWHAQMAWYVDGAIWNKLPVTHAKLICVEREPPHCVTVLRLSDRMLEKGRECIALWCSTLRACETSGNWPGHVQSEVEWDWEEWGSSSEDAEDYE